MQKIKQLPAHEAQKIAAGEVVERPANVIKELVENALDAGATHITIKLNHAGIDGITITDNGFGMSQEDARLCIAQYATSKITSVNELETINTFGFRGEALASIAAVSRMRICTKEAATLHGTALTIEQGTILDEQAVAINTGTTIEIRDLFYNVPARKKFLKKKETEWRCIQQLFQAFCFDYPAVHFTLEHDDRVVYNCPSVQSAHERITQIWDTTLSKQMIPLTAHNTDHNIGIHGIISHHQYGRYDRSALFIFVNRRWVKNYTLTKALLKGYANVIPTDKYPAACIHIEIDPRSVDINIHPRKEEIQFLHPRVVEQLIQQSVKQALEEHLSQQLNKPVTFKNPEPAFSNLGSSSKSSFFNQPYRSLSSHDSVPILRQAPPFAHPGVQLGELRRAPQDERGILQKSEQQVHTLNSVYSAITTSSTVNTPSEIRNQTITLNPVRPEFIEGYERDKSTPFSIIGQFNNTYILIEQEQGLFIIDQHAAHERILYEQFAQRFGNIPTINLLFPQIITLTEQEIVCLEAHLDLFAHNGITLERFGSNQMIVQSLPVHCKALATDELLKNVAHWIGEHTDLDAQQLCKLVNDKMQTKMACSAAIKAGDQLSIEQMRQLVTDLNKTENRFCCPHGRPTGWLLSLSEIEKYFKRDYR